MNSEYLPLVSIIIPTFNRVDLIGETLLSIKNQSYGNWECIIVDDGSTDNTEAIIHKLIKNENRIQFYKRNRLPKGAPTCRNIGIEKSKGEYVVFLDSDDLMANFCLERRLDFFIEYPDNDFLVFQSILFEKTIDDKNLLWNINTDENDLNRFLRTDALWPICGPVYKKEIFKRSGLFKEGLPFYQDFDLHLRMLLMNFKYRKFLNEKPDCFIRHHFNNSVSNSIAFTSDKKVLQQRIDFFIDQLNFINREKIYLGKQQKETIWNVLFYFCSRLLTEHRDRKSFYDNWIRVREQLPINMFKHYAAFFAPVLSNMQQKSKYYIKLRTLYSRIFQKYLADDNVIHNSTLFKIELAT